MRPWLLAALAAAGCRQILGIEDGVLRDGGGALDASRDGSCTWTFTPSGFDPCTPFFAVQGTSWQFNDPVTTTIDTNLPAGADDPPIMDTTLDGYDVRYYRAAQLVVAPGASLVLEGSRAVIFVVDSIDVAGIIVARSGSGQPTNDCLAANGIAGSCGQGGAGGAFGGGGGAGGGCSGLTVGQPTALNGNPSLIPFRGGCRGGAGGPTSTDPANTPAPGEGGGALRISARDAVTVSGAIKAPGDPGAGGGTDKRGGAGGGSGGSLFLEGISVTVIGGLCAEGGGGGGGGDPANAGLSGTGGCSGGVPAGGPGGGPESYGGNGGYGLGAMLDGVSGGTASVGGGGGGGGGAGRIRIRCQDCEMTGVISPATYPEPL